MPKQTKQSAAQDRSPLLTSMRGPTSGSEFRTWRERLAAWGNVLTAVLRYTRKSTESDDRQATSHAQ